jgi:hypothetical protein
VSRVRFRYADVVSTLALCLALGGTAYATGILPAGSVGNRQLKVGAVSQPKLAFPLGIASTTVSAQTLPPASNCGALGTCPVVPARPVLTLSLKLAHGGVVMVDVGASLTAAAAAAPDAVNFSVTVDGGEPHSEIVNDDVVGGSSQQVSGMSAKTLTPGVHTIARYANNRGASAVALSNVEMIAAALPKLP